MAKPKIAVFSGPYATIANSPTLVTSNKGRLPGDPALPGRFDHLAAQTLYEPVMIKIAKFSAHPLEEDARDVYHDDGKGYYEVELRPEDGHYPLPYVARRADGSSDGVPFEEDDLSDPELAYGGRQFFFPDASRIFADIDRTIGGRDERGEGSTLDRKAEFDFIRALPSGGHTRRGEVAGRDFFPYKPLAIGQTRSRLRDLATVANSVQCALDSGDYAGAIWLECSSTIEETLYWLSLMVDTDLPIAGCASQRTHGQLANDGDRNIVDAVSYVLSGSGNGLGAVGVQDERIFAARDFKKGDDRPGGYKATGGHGGILGTVGPPVTIWYTPTYRHTAASAVSLHKLEEYLESTDRASGTARVRIKSPDGALDGASIPRVTMFKYASYMDENDGPDPDAEVGIMARVKQALDEQADSHGPKLHGMVLEGDSPYAMGSGGQAAALAIATFSGIPVVRVGRSDPGGLVPSGLVEFTVEGSNLDANKARILLIASMLKLGRLPKACDPRNPTANERAAVSTKLADFQDVFDSH